MSQLAGNAKQPVHLGVMVRAEQRRELAKLAEREDRSVSTPNRSPDLRRARVRISFV
jgi:hypothetical protein